ncbi:hypothetical protein A3H90_00125 [Candidatus Peribacteria bacterium RIFCSPLOWO2_02_FULL_55_36]|nr:MAG: hypothetical protein A2789_01600 [Candidatus Peribacteria bacterium RIFCSPHIGHO2_01_FULL_54_22]OGJ62875.1 MAG: hypothetical protein A3D12_00995 [Candidatus Peribacteria bacterium RIFCSPHIGHO2_02_FULL_55_24]OGJ69208.1 MAG: hypothetical protein A3H90_00125 [Candidatus Peribacteria bacterium RIFCSPLOWO2_02_FULL_55_36]
MDLYAENILDHYRNPRGKSPLLPQRERGQGRGPIQHTESNPACGDEITVGISLQNDHISEICWDGTGCAISQAAMSMLSEELEGKTLEDIDHLTKDSLLALLGVPIGPRRLKCALLGLHACKNALCQFQKIPLRSWSETVA